jgi:Kdo2-lipid IVA lauroyltransferase/acyltransferase
MSAVTAKGSFAERAQAALLTFIVRALQCLSPVASSNLGGWLARSLGPWLPISRVADANLRPALPELDAAGRARVIRGVWDNLGRTAAELPHLASFRRSDVGPGWEIEGSANIAQLRATGGQALFFSGHFGNWELILPIAAALGLHTSGFYRAASNVAVNRLIQSLRQSALAPDTSMFPKGAQGARSALLHLHHGGSLGLLIDQKMNDGIPVQFFGRDAMTAPALAQFALRFDVPIMPVHILRLGPARFRMICDPPLTVARTGNKETDLHAITLAVNRTLERWIRADPSSWLWLHRRWPKPLSSPA